MPRTVHGGAAEDQQPGVGQRADTYGATWVQHQQAAGLEGVAGDLDLAGQQVDGPVLVLVRQRRLAQVRQLIGSRSLDEEVADERAAGGLGS